MGRRKKGDTGPGQGAAAASRAAEPGSGPPAGLVLLVALAVCAPFLPALLDGGLSVEAAAVRFLGALALSWVACATVASLVHRYADSAGSRDTGGSATPQRRRDDPS